MSDSEDVLVAWFELWNAHDLARLATLVAPDYVHHTMTGADIDLAGFRAGFGAVLDAFPDVTYSLEHSLFDGDLAGAYLSSVGTHRGNYFGIPATGQRLHIRGMYHCRIADGRIAEHGDVFDLLTPLFQMGASITPPS